MDGVNAGQKKAMADIMAAMNRAMSAPITESHTSPVSSNDFGGAAIAPPSMSGTDDAKVTAMKNIMDAFKNATSNVRETAQDDPYLMEALQTERTSRGVRVAEWEITITEQAGRAGKFYDVTRDDITIASDLRLYEAALLLTQELNKGQSITSPKVREILRLEEDFAKNLEDAARYARVAKASSGKARMIAEDRYSDARAKAIRAKDEIKRVS